MTRRSYGNIDIHKIIKVIPNANYIIEVPWESVKSHIDSYIEYYDLDLSPEFQRKYKWPLSMQRDYIENMLKGSVTGRDIYFNCPSFNTYEAESAMVLVDGQQRLKSLLRFIDNRFKILGKYYQKDISRIMHVRFIFHIHDLKTRDEEIDWYVMLNNTGMSHTKEEIEHVKSYKSKPITKI